MDNGLQGIGWATQTINVITPNHIEARLDNLSLKGIEYRAPACYYLSSVHLVFLHSTLLLYVTQPTLSITTDGISTDSNSDPQGVCYMLGSVMTIDEIK